MKQVHPIRRVARSRQEAAANYDRLSRWYDLLSGASERRYKEKGLQLLNAQPGERLLEVGFGTGECLLSLAASAGESGGVVGVDLSTGMACVARNKLRIANMAHLVTLACADAASLPFPEEHFDALLMSFTLELFDTPEIPLVLAECRRVLRPGGRMSVVSLAKKESWVVRLYERAHERWPRAIDCRPIYPAQALQGAGFRIDPVIELSMFGLPVECVLAFKTAGDQAGDQK